MTIAYLDCSRGISGSAALAALIDAGADADAIGDALRSMPNVEGVGVTDGFVGPFRVRRVTIRDAGVPARRLEQVETVVAGMTLPPRALARITAIYRRLASAEARVHGSEPAAVTFHEIGSARSLAGVVGTALALELLGVERIVSSPVAVGRGTVETAHGTLPVPAPATLELLRGVPVVAGHADGELVTPTGAAIVAEASAFGPMPDMTIDASGYGADDVGRPSLMLRTIIGRSRVTVSASGPADP